VVTVRTLAWIGLAVLLGLVESGCGGSTQITPPPLSISTATLRDGMATFPYSQTIAATGGVAPFVWSVAFGNLPQNVVLASSSAATVTLSGTPDIAQIAAFAIEVRDSRGQSATKNYAINIATNGSLQIQSSSGQAPAGIVEIQGVSASSFNPVYWQQNTLNWIPDLRMPMFAAQTSGPYQNIYAPWALELPGGGWRLFYGGWDGQDVPFDQISSTTTADFLNFGVRDHVIANGAFLNVNNVNVQQLPDGSLHMICTGGQAGNADNFPLYFASPDGTVWNGVSEPYSAQLTDIISISGYTGFNTGDFNGANVLLNDNGTWALYFVDWNNPGHVYRTTAASLPNFQAYATTLGTQHLVNDVKKIQVNGQSWYLMGLHYNSQSVWFSLSNDGTSFTAEQTLFNNFSSQDLNIVAVGFVMKGNQLLGTLYGATAVPTLDQNQIFARWLQKKVILVDSSGSQSSLQGSYGPDRQWFQSQSGGIQGTILVYDDDGVTPLASGTVNFAPGNAYQLIIGGG
jgi:hypothetical protein